MLGARFALKEPETWGTPDEVIELEDPYWGQLRLERWGALGNGLHEKKGADVPLRCNPSQCSLSAQPEIADH